MADTNQKKTHRKFIPKEDKQLRRLVEEFGENWNEIVKHMPNRNVRQCRERWNNYLDPNINKDPWTEEEDNLLLEKQQTFGNKWTTIVQYFDREFNRRTEYQLRDRYNVLRRRKRSIENQSKSINQQQAQQPTPSTNSQQDLFDNMFETGDDFLLQTDFYPDFYDGSGLDSNTENEISQHIDNNIPNQTVQPQQAQQPQQPTPPTNSQQGFLDNMFDAGDDFLLQTGFDRDFYDGSGLGF